MKKNMISRIICTLSAFVCLGSANSTVTATEPTVEQIADGFAQAPVAYWFGSKQFIGNGTNEIRESFTLQLFKGRWAITQLRIGDKELPINPAYPLLQFPAYAGTVQNLWLNVQGYGSDGKEKRHGYFSANTLAKGADIKILVELSYIQVFIPYMFPNGHSSVNTRIQSDDGNYKGWHDYSTGGFMVSFDPLRPPQKFNLIDTRNNMVFDQIDFKGKNPGQDPGSDDKSGFSLEIEGGTVEAYFVGDDWYAFFSGLNLDQKVDRKGGTYNSKIILAHMTVTTDYLQVYTYGISQGSMVEVWGSGPNGIMKFLASKQMPNSQGETVIISDITGYLDYKVVLVGGTLNPVSGAQVDMYRSSNPWNYTNGKGE